MVFVERIGPWVGSTQHAVDYMYLILRKESQAWNIDVQRYQYVGAVRNCGVGEISQEKNWIERSKRSRTEP